MAALKDIARDNADELRDGIAWVIVYRTGRSWHALPVWSDLEGDGWETDDLNEALGILKVDPDAVILNGYYCGHFGEDMTINQLAAGIRWHYENGYNRLAYRDDIEEAQASIEEARKAAEAAGLPFSEKLADGAEDEPNPYIYDGSMTVTDFEMMQGARATHQEIAAVVEAHLPGIAPDKLDEIAHAAAGLRISPATMQRILEGFNAIAAKVGEIVAILIERMKPVVEAAAKILGSLWDKLGRAVAPPKWWHLYKHSKKARVRKKYRKRIGRLICAALACEGGGSS